MESFINSGKKQASTQKKIPPICNSSGKITTQKVSDRKPMENACFNCQKAQVIVIECELCGYMIRKVLCDVDMRHNRHKLRDPYLLQCESSNISP